MRITPKHMAYASVLGLGAVALALDSAFPPAGASAATPPPTIPVGVATPGASPAAQARPDAGLAPLADRLAQMNAMYGTEGQPARDVFAVDEQAWGIQTELVAPAPQPVADARNFNLMAIIVNRTESVAVVNGTMVSVGDFVAGTGYQVTDISPRRVMLERDGSTVVLSWDPNRN
ncbi:MAG: hypothetical protein R3B68_10950 [Phycisphaerales bacterium]